MNADAETDPPEDDASGGSTVVMVLAALATFAAGTLFGVIIDGNAELVNAFNARSRPAAVRQTAAIAAMPTDGPTATAASASTSVDKAEAAAEYPRNNEVRWAITVAPGTPTALLEIRNNSITRNARIDLSMAYSSGETRRTASIWVRSASSATLALPVATYAVSALSTEKGADTEADAVNPSPPFGVVRISKLDPDQTPPSLVGDSRGRFRSMPAGEISEERPRPQRRRRSTEDREGYGDLGRGSRDGGTPTYGNDGA